ncbi:hypothetical protein EV421DRAFT_1737541 [Armillaria borealis]|uniref:Uncharacterized protein n=1 Tax=Armillaria borealis TaxID=47425 RepID=A0AA39MN91_9AGAR|nr:hypothetical protein EV421DRAFT_1737541 [Armillaria borealis]
MSVRHSSTISSIPFAAVPNFDVINRDMKPLLQSLLDSKQQQLQQVTTLGMLGAHWRDDELGYGDSTVQYSPIYLDTKRDVCVFQWTLPLHKLTLACFFCLQFYQSLLLELALAFSTNNDDLTSRALKQNKKRLKKLLAVSDDASEQKKNESGQLENIIKDLTAKHETAVALARKWIDLKLIKAGLAGNLISPTSNTTEGRQDDDYLTPVEYGDDPFSNTASTNRKNKADTSLLLSMNGRRDQSPMA